MAHIEGSYLVLDKEKVNKLKKVTGSRVGQLMGIDPFNLKGDCVLGMFNMIKSEVDEFFQVRGIIAEKIVNAFYGRFHKTIHYDQAEVNYDLFQDIKGYGGVIDIEIPEQNTLIEVKGKNLKDYAKICKDGALHQEIQGLFYGTLKSYPKIIMAWVFFDDELENLIRKHIKDKTLNLLKLNKDTLKNIKIETKILEVHPSELKPKFREAYNYAKWCFDNRKIPLCDISDKSLKQLGLSRY